jgi:hypothetical protein
MVFREKKNKQEERITEELCHPPNRTVHLLSAANQAQEQAMEVPLLE